MYFICIYYVMIKHIWKLLEIFGTIKTSMNHKSISQKMDVRSVKSEDAPWGRASLSRSPAGVVRLVAVR